MARTYDVAVIVGSLRRESFSRRLALALAKLAPPSLKFEIVEIGALQHFNQDLEKTPTAEWTAFKQRIATCDAVLFVTPEYNRSVPGALKNAIDVASRPYGQSAWSGKPAAVVSSSPGAIGGFGANHHLRQSLVFLDMPVLQQPEIYLSRIDKVLGDGPELADPAAKDLLVQFLQRFQSLIERTAGTK
jgi:chromate reductase, NAD(P)H dehydrogenase (quinone)